MRLFIALNINKKERSRVIRAARPLLEEDLPVRWVEEADLHLTLKFLGEVRRERVPAVEEAMARVGESTAPFSMTLSGFGAFPTIRRPRVLWLGVDASPALRCLKQDLEWGLTDCGFEAETRAFHPHVTLGRVDAKDGGGRSGGWTPRSPPWTSAQRSPCVALTSCGVFCPGRAHAIRAFPAPSSRAPDPCSHSSRNFWPF